MKILLINPSWDGVVSGRGRRHNRAWPPLDLLYCAGLLEQEGHSVELIDARARRHPLSEIAETAATCDRVFLTTSPMDRWQCPNLEVDQVLATTSVLPAGGFYLLGAHGTMMPEPMLRATGARALVLGEPERAVLELCRTETLSSVPGLVYLDSDQLVETGAALIEDVNTLPTPAFHLLDLDHYHYELLGKRLVLLEGARGCPWSCHFCYLDMYGRRYRKRDPEQVIRDVQIAVEEHDARSAYFIDLEFTVHRRLVDELCDFLIASAYPLRWACQTRLDAIDPEMLQKMKAAGCRLIHYGVESGSEQILAATNKRITLDQIRHGMRITHQAGIDSACFFLLGFPDETDDQREQTIRFAKELNPTYASFHVVTPYPDTHFHESLITTRELPLLDSFPQLGDGDPLRMRARRAMMEYYLRPRYITGRLVNASPASLARQARLFWSSMR